MNQLPQLRCGIVLFKKRENCKPCVASCVRSSCQPLLCSLSQLCPLSVSREALMLYIHSLRAWWDIPPLRQGLAYPRLALGWIHPEDDLGLLIPCFHLQRARLKVCTAMAGSCSVSIRLLHARQANCRPVSSDSPRIWFSVFVFPQLHFETQCPSSKGRVAVLCDERALKAIGAAASSLRQF